MVIDVILAVAGSAVLLLLTFSTLIAGQGRRSDQLLVAPRGARFGDASRLARRAARERRPATLEARDAVPSVVELGTFARSDRRAA
jgi:hypothetical protein